MGEIINSFPGYEHKRLEDGRFHNMYRGEDLGYGGWVYSKPGIYRNVALIDAASLHPTSIILLNKLGKFTKRYADLREARVLIKHGDYEKAGELFDGKLKKYLGSKDEADALSSALKIPLNSFYGISSASYSNPARDSRDKNNIIALRGALFMKTLFDAVVEKGYEVIHIKTDSIKIANSDDYIVKFVQEFGKSYGYEMEHEATYDRICLVDKAQYIARYDSLGIRNKGGKHADEWTATGAQFQQPYVFKTLFSGEPIEFDDLCETKSVSGSVIFLDMNEKLHEQEDAETEKERRIYNLAHPDKPKKLNPEFSDFSDDELNDIIASGHDYQFVGRVGLFTPIKPGCGGGVMYRFKDGKYYSITGTKGYRWLEAEMVQKLGKQNDIDLEYHQHLVDEAIAEIERFGSFDRFVDLSKPYEVDIPAESNGDDDDPPWYDLPPVVPCGDGKYNTCLECPNCKDDICKRGYSLSSYVENGRNKM